MDDISMHQAECRDQVSFFLNDEVDYKLGAKSEKPIPQRIVALHVNLDKMPELRRETFTA